MIKNANLSLLVLTGMLSGSSANSCSMLSSQRDCERVRGCHYHYSGMCTPNDPTVLLFPSCSVLSQSDCENSRFCHYDYDGFCDGTPWTGTAAEGEALLSLEAAADDPNYDDYEYDAYGDTPDALPNANDYSGSGSTRTNLRGWNQEQELQ